MKQEAIHFLNQTQNLEQTVVVRNLTNNKEPPMKVKVIADIEILQNLEFPEVSDDMEKVQGPDTLVVLSHEQTTHVCIS